MADITFPVAGGGSKRLKDMGDGTVAEVVAVGSATGASNTVSPVVQLMTIGTGAAVVIPNATQGSAVALTGRKSLYVRADDANTGIIYIGDANVSTTVYIRALHAGEDFGDDLGTGTLYALSDTASQKLHTYER